MAEGKRVLLVEDNEVNEKIACIFIGKLGYDVTVARSGAEAVSAQQQDPCDVVLMDCNMPGMDGFEATRIIRENEQKSDQKRVPVVALTAHAYSDVATQCQEAGMDDYLSKPMLLGDLKNILDKHCH